MILSDHDIRERLYNYDNKLEIEPFDRMFLQPASYDLHLGNDFIHYKSDRTSRPIDSILGDNIHVGIEGEFSRFEPLGGFVLMPGDFLLAETFESIKLPLDLAGRLEGKSSLGRIGTFIHVTAGYIDPGFSGRLTLEIVTAMPYGIILHEGQKISQLSLHQLSSPANVGYHGKYQFAKGVQSSKGVGQ